MYGLVFVLMRASGKRTFGQLTAFDFVLLLILAETTQQALVGNDYSITNAAVVITTLLGIDIAFSLVKQRWPRVGDFLDGTPLLMIHNGEMQRERMKRARVSESDILEAGRKLHGLERMDQIKHAVLEQSGSISIIPK